MKRLFFALCVLMLANAQASAQSSPGWATDFVPTALQWNQEFASKQDYLGAAPCLVSGCTLQGKLTTIASAAANAGLNLPPGAAPSFPVNGDVWVTSVGLFAQINGATVGPLGNGVVGTLAVGSGGTGQSSFSANLPLIGNGSSALGQGTRSGNTTAFATVTGALVNGHCVSIDGSGNLVDAGGACTTGGGGGTVASATIGQLGIYTAATTIGGLASCNNGYVGTDGAGVNACRTTLNSSLQSSITALGTIATGVWQGTPVGGTYGGTGVNNGASTITLGGSLTLSGAFPTTFTVTGSTSVTLPTSGTLLNQNGTSGGVPYYSSSSTVGSSAALSANNPVIGGGAGTAPSSGSRSGNTTNFGTVSGSLTSGNGLKADASGNIVDFGSVPASLSVADQTLSGGANVNPFSIGTVSSGTTLIDCGQSPLQFMTNNGASIIAAPTIGGSCIIYVVNGASAGAISFSGFTVSSNTGDALNTTNGNKFFISIVRINGVSNYVVRALQ